MKQPNKEEIARLLHKAKQGDNEAYMALSAMYSPMLRRIKKSFCQGLSEVDCAEVAEEAEIAFFRAVQTYSDKSDVTFGCYARTCVRNSLISLYRKRNRVIPTLPIEEWLPLFEEPADDPAIALIEAEDAVATLRKMKKFLSPYEQKVFDLYAEGNSVAEIAKVLGKTEKSVSNAIFRLLQKLREQF
ncbi:MAG: RNA polymerase sigma factor [Clostridia bacterium]|nr:RNA polymerase sigma factor [Clostridia bacterium]